MTEARGLTKKYGDILAVADLSFTVGPGVPKRLPVLWAKLVVLTTATATSMIAASFIASLGAEAFISQDRHGYSLGDPGVLRVVIGTGIFLALVGMFGSALGWALRSTPGALVAFFATSWPFPWSWSSSADGPRLSPSTPRSTPGAASSRAFLRRTRAVPGRAWSCW